MTERWAVISDVHGNVRALDAVLADIGRRGIETIVNLGDCAYGPFDPGPAVDRLIQRQIPTVAGNEDRVLADVALGLFVSRAAAFTVERLTADQLEWLLQLPASRIEKGMLLVHGTPTDDTTYLLSVVERGRLSERSVGELEPLLAGRTERVILCGHDHTPRVVVLPDGRTIVNPGSVGCPAYTDDAPPHVVEAGSPHARYAVVTVDGGQVRFKLIAVEYDWCEAAAEAFDNGFPEWAHWLATGLA